ncbi:MAG: hypothetical protein ACK55O_07045 [Phycisphaerales bacterium]
MIRLDLFGGIVAHQHDAALGRLHERAGDGLAATLTPAQIDRSIDERVVRARGQTEGITGSDFAKIVRQG